MDDKQAHTDQNGRVDLHSHSYASNDGAGYPGDIARHFKQAGFAAFSLTDHGSYLGQEEAARVAAEVGIEFIPGVEITASVGDEGLPTDDRADILCYFYELTPEVRALGVRHEEFFGTICRFLEASVKAGKLAMDPSGFEAYLESRYGELGVAHWPGIQREALGQILIECGLIDLAEGRERGFDECEWSRQQVAVHLNDYNLPSPPLELETVCRVMKQAGAVLILAHPGSGKREASDTERARITRWLDRYVDGIEVFHHRNNPGYRSMLLDIARRRDCPYTGGGDRHNIPGDARLAGINPGSPEALTWNAGPAKLYGHISEAPLECLHLLRQAANKRQGR